MYPNRLRSFSFLSSSIITTGLMRWGVVGKCGRGVVRGLTTTPSPPLSEERSKMEKTYETLLEGNLQFVEQQLTRDPGFFERLSRGQTPQTLFIGCSDALVPPEIITGQDPGQIFVHSNVANTVVHTDVNLLSVLQYAVDILNVKHIIVCGHYGCGGIVSSMTNQEYGMVDNWLRNIKDEYLLHRDELESIENHAQRCNRMAELHVVEGVYNVCRTSIIRNAWIQRKDSLIFPHIHGWIYSPADGSVKDLNITIRGPSEVPLLVQSPVDPAKCI